MKTAFMLAYQGVRDIYMCVCVCVLSYLPCLKPNRLQSRRQQQQHRIDFVNCSLFAFHSGLVELSAVISVIALPFSVNSFTPSRASFLPPLGSSKRLYVMYI